MDRRTKKISLEFMGEGWDECYVELYYLTWAETKQILELETGDASSDWIKLMVERIQMLFVSGKVLADGKPVELTKDGIAEFDVDALTKLNSAALGFTDPKEPLS